MPQAVSVFCAFKEMHQTSSLKPNPSNPNKHPEEQIRLLAKIITTQGWRAPIVISKRSGMIVKGHARHQAALHAKLPEVPVDIQEYESEEAEKADLIADNRLAELAEIDTSELTKMLKELEEEGFDVELAGFNTDAVSALLDELKEETDQDAEPELDKAQELGQKWGVKEGDVWQIGNHKLACGDSTNPQIVSRLLGEDIPQMMVTDPPYGVEYDPSWRAEAGINKNKAKMGIVKNDDRVDWTETWKLFPGDVVYVWHAGRFSSRVQESIENAGFNVRAQIIWGKDRMALSRGDYHWQHEPCWYAVREGKPAKRNDDRTQTTLWEIVAREDSGHGHGTQKPLECMARPIRNHTFDMIYDPFGGSVTTMVASENLKKTCRMIELSTDYCGVILERMTQAFPDLKVFKT